MAASFQKSTAREYFESIVIAVILALFIRTWVVQAFKIPTGSMEQNLLIGDHLLVNKLVFGPVSGFERPWLPVADVERGDVLVFKFPDEPERDFIKRVIALPGEQIEIKDGRVFIDGAQLEEPYLHTEGGARGAGATPPVVLDVRDQYGPVAVPERHYFMMGDNRHNSQDSRFWGPLPHTLVKGKAMVIYWSFDAPTSAIPPAGLDGVVRRVLSVGANFFTGTRWDRMFKQVP